MIYWIAGAVIAAASLYGFVIFGTLSIDTDDEYFKGKL